MCAATDSLWIAAAVVLVAILALILAARLWVAVADYLLRRRVTLRGAIGKAVADAFDRTEGRVAVVFGVEP